VSSRPEFDAGILSVAPGGITKVVETTYGYHVIRRHTWDEIKAEFTQKYPELAVQRAESTFQAKVAADANVVVRPAAAKIVKSIANDPDMHREDRTVVATSRKGNMTASRLAMWVAGIPSSARMRPQIAQAPDSIAMMFVADVMRNELLLKAADSAGMQPDSADVKLSEDAFFRGVLATMEALNLMPASLGDSASDAATRQALASERIEGYMTRLVRNEVNFVDVPEPIVIVLRDRFESRISAAGVDRAVTAAQKLRAASDSTRAADQPPTAVPLPAPQP
jgi:peptidyl-prolyl cis-trans isomerase D